MKKLINWLEKTDIKYMALSLCILLFFIMIIFLAIHLQSRTLELQKNNIQIDALLDANNLLVERVVELETKERKEIDNIRNYILRYYRTVPPIVAIEIARNIIIASDKHNIPITPIVAVMEIESQFNASARSSKGARGLMQVMPNYWMKELNINSKYDFHDIEIGIDSGAYILKKYLCNKNNNMEKALFKYVGGDNSYINKVYKSMGKFVVFKGLSEETVEEENKVLTELIDEEPEITSVPKTFVHTVKYRGETLSLIAKCYTGDLSNWKKIHKLNPNIIEKRMQIGEKITIPIEMMNSFVLLTKEYVQTN